MNVISEVPLGLFLDGAARTAVDGATSDVRNPATGQTIAAVPNAGVEDAVAAVDDADRAAAAWAATPPRERSEILRRAYELMIRDRESLASLIVAENGKVLNDARSEVGYAAEFLRWYAEEAVRVPGSVRRAPAGGNRIMVQHKPIGICVMVTPWNFPAAMATRKIGPALAAGCTMILKPASATPLTALVLGALLAEAGVPDGVVNILPSARSSETVAAMLADPRTRKLSFTGSTEVGQQLLRAAAGSVLASSMELGGNAPFVVFADADLSAAVDGAMLAKMRNGGEACTAANRFIVEHSVVDEFTERLTERMGALVMGDGSIEGVDLGPLISSGAREKVDELVRSAISDGATATIGGAVPDGPGWFYPATVLARVAPGARILDEEIFGPVAPVVPFDTEEQGARLANATPYGLASYVYTGDLERGLRFAESLEVGMVGINRGLVSDPAAPFGGVKQSGLGREGGEEGLLEYLESQYIAVEW